MRVCIFGTEVKANTVGRVEGSGGLTPHGPSAVGGEAGRVMKPSVGKHAWKWFIV